MPLFLTDNFSRFFSYCKKHKRGSLLFILSLLSISVFIINPSFAVVNSVKEPVVTITAKNEPLKKVLEKISKATGYKIEVTEGWENRLITADFINSPLDTSLKKIIKALGGPSNSIVTYENAKNIKINIFDSSAGSLSNMNEFLFNNDNDKVIGIDLTYAELKELHKKQSQGIEEKKKNLEEIIIPLSKDEEALTRKQIDKLHEKQKLEIEKMMSNPDEIVIPAEGDQPAVTRGELEALHRKQKEKIEKMMSNPDEIVIPAEGDQPAVTRGELEALHRKQKEKIEKMMNDPNEIVIPAEGDQPAVTRGELEALHRKQEDKIRIDVND